MFLETKLCWDSHFEEITTLQMVQLLKWIDQYSIKFQEEVQDSRFKGGIRALLKIFGRRVWNSLKPMMVAVVQNDRTDNYFEEEGVIYSNGIIDLFKLLNDSFKIYTQEYSSKAMARMLGHVARRGIELYLKILQGVVDESMISQQQLAAISNNVIYFNRFLKEFVEDKLLFFEIEEADANEVIQYASLTKMYSDITTVTRNKLAGALSTKLAKFYQSKKYPLVLLDGAVGLINDNIQIMDCLHDINKRAFWKLVLEFVVGEIIRSLAANSTEKRKDNVTIRLALERSERRQTP